MVHQQVLLISQHRIKLWNTQCGYTRTDKHISKNW